MSSKFKVKAVYDSWPNQSVFTFKEGKHFYPMKFLISNFYVLWDVENTSILINSTAEVPVHGVGITTN